ncbi:MAG: aquaporin [Gemmatimonadetes bacterium]|nr:aquaporin [Gemmatimonadota bacterium]
MGAKLRPLTAEFIGTFGLVFIGAGSIVVNEASGALGLLGVALAHAMVLSVMVTALMRISGAHFNPAVTFGLWLANKIEAKDAGLYVLTQLVAAVVAALLVKTLLPSVAGEITGYGLPRIASNVDLIQAILLEAILTFFLVSAVFGTAVSPEAPSGIGGFGIGLVLLFDILVGGPLTGAAMNPARAFGPAAIANDWVGQGAFWIGPLLGGAVAALVWGKVLLPKDE